MIPANCSKRAVDLIGRSRIITEHDMLDVLDLEFRRAATKTEVADKCGVSKQYLRDVMTGRRGVGEKIAAGLGWKRVVVFVKQ